ncbi:MAG: hypothetical protein ACJASX_001135 [Limisphaerales bacterium]|jgi:hypothetical protein
MRDPKAEGTRKDLIMESPVQFVVRDGDWKLCFCPGSGMPTASENGAGNDPEPNVAGKKHCSSFREYQRT